MEQEEKRQAPRVEVQLSVDVHTKYMFTAASVLNISNEGLFIKTQNPLPEGSEVEIIMHSTKRKKPHHFKGIVRWGRNSNHGSVPPGMGVRLIEPDEKEMNILVREIRKFPKNY